MNDYGTCDVDNTEHGHYASKIVFQAETRADCEQWLYDLTDEEYEKLRN